MKLIDKDAVVEEIERRKGMCDNHYGEYWNGCYNTMEDIISFLNSLEVKEVDLNLIVGWFEHIAQIADDRKTLNGVVMEDWAALDEIKCLARNSAEFIKIHYKAQKGK